MSSESHSGLLGLSGSLLGLTTAALGLRLYARRKQNVPLMSDDWIALASWFTFIGTVSVTFWGVQYHHLGYPEPMSPAAELTALKAQAQIALSFDVLSTATFAFAKISALLFYRRVFCVSGRSGRFHIFLMICVAIVSLWLVAYIILPILQCGTHISALWIESERAEYCKYSEKYTLSQAISDFLLEVLVLVTPVPSIWKLHASVARRLAVSFVFLTALVGFGACIARLATYVRLSNEAKEGKVVDYQLADTQGIYLSVLEAGLSIIAVNLPTLFFLRKHANPSKVLQSVRSVMSLRSVTSKVSKASQNGGHSSDNKGDTRSSVSVRSLVPQQQQNNQWHEEVYAMPHLGKDEEAALGNPIIVSQKQDPSTKY